MAKLNPYLSFQNNCREAMNFYKDSLGGQLDIKTVGEMPEMAAQMPATMKDAVLHSMLVSGDMVIMGSDLSREKPIEGNTFSICINCDNETELRAFFTKLSAGGKVVQPVGEMPWGGMYAELIDKYGKLWALNYQKA